VFTVLLHTEASLLCLLFLPCQVVLPVQLLALDLSALSDAELAQACQKAVSKWLTSNPGVLQGSGSSKAAAMSSSNEAAASLFQELRPDAPLSLRRMLALCGLIGEPSSTNSPAGDAHVPAVLT
jgi:hypothetical protein